ncbi:hypothetical protein O2W14_10525 [Modestobacter sp. VKM Ac-2986]|uniref:hypothetical protein n=1 Tax=Modestobacter sp. VKM Ac-2986 TaxID=3004140 RepID=UPI0022ABAD74|nr:hypothetical protein [Modestobacter sp. VKM Ac-2986]MCZ2829266.1 hypothetical protein [Modestobacter sp. VKM Ac-2986]
MTDVGQDVGARLTRLARQAHPPDGGSTVDRVLDVARSRRLRTQRGVAAAVAVLVLGTTATLARPDAAPTVQAAPADASATPSATRPAAPSSRPPAPPPEVYEQPPRGSLAGDPEFLAGVAALPWSPAMDLENGVAAEVEPDTRRVLYAADVPGGHRWAVVMARSHQSWAVNWFTGPAGADPAGMTEASYPSSWSPTEPLALMDASTEAVPLVVFGDPGIGYEYSPSLDRAPDGSLVREFQPLPVVDGVPLGVVPRPVVWGAGALRRSTGEDRSTDDDRTPGDGWSPGGDFRYVGAAPWESWYGEAAGPPDMAVLVPCLTALGYDVTVGPGESEYGWSDPTTVERSSTEQAVREKATADCQNAASGG